MPGSHTRKQKRQAEHVADSERRRGKDPKDAERIGWATVNARAGGVSKGSTLTPDGSRYRLTGPDHVHLKFSSRSKAKDHARAHAAHYGQVNEIRDHSEASKFHAESTAKFQAARGIKAPAPPAASKGLQLLTLDECSGSEIGKAAEVYLPRPKTEWATPREGMSRMNYGVRSKKDTTARRRVGIKPLGTHTVTAKGLLTIDAAYDLLKDMDPAKVRAYHADAAKVRAPDPKRTMHVDRPPPTTSDVASRPQAERRKFPRKPKPTVAMKPISNEEAAQHLASGAYSPSKQKSLRWLAALKALATGYSKTAGGGALKAANRGRAMPLLGPSGRTAGKPGGHYRTRRLSGKVSFGPDGRPGPKSDKAQFGKRPSRRLRRALEASSSAELSNRIANVVIKSEGAEMPSQRSNVDFNDLFKSELAGDHLVDCPHCDEPITREQLAKGHKGKGKVTHESGAKRGKSSAHVRDHNPEGGTTRGGDGRGVITPSRGVPGAQKTDPPAGVQNSKGSNARKGGADSSIEEGEDDVDKSVEAAPDEAAARPRPTGSTDPGAPVKKSITIRGTPFVQYIDDGSDAELAKSILEGRLGGTPPTQPLDLNNDLTRLLV